jgi:hypothetical protein
MKYGMRRCFAFYSGACCGDITSTQERRRCWAFVAVIARRTVPGGRQVLDAKTAAVASPVENDPFSLSGNLRLSPVP